MPLYDNPNALGTLVLDADANQPIENRRALIVKRLNCEQADELDEQLSEAAKLSTSNKDFRKRILEIVGPYITGWKNVNDKDGQSIPFSIDNLRTKLWPGEVADIARTLAYPLTEDDKKN